MLLESYHMMMDDYKPRGGLEVKVRADPDQRSRWAPEISTHL